MRIPPRSWGRLFAALIVSGTVGCLPVAHVRLGVGPTLDTAARAGFEVRLEGQLGIAEVRELASGHDVTVPITVAYAGVGARQVPDEVATASAGGGFGALFLVAHSGWMVSAGAGFASRLSVATLGLLPSAGAFGEVGIGYTLHRPIVIGVGLRGEGLSNPALGIFALPLFVELAWP